MAHLSVTKLSTNEMCFGSLRSVTRGGAESLTGILSVLGAGNLTDARYSSRAD